jgi:hypothetical protein
MTQNTGKETISTNKKAYRSIWLDKLTYLLVREWANWRKTPFKKRLLLKRALAVLIYCGAKYFQDHRQDLDLRYPDALQIASVSINVLHLISSTGSGD